MFLIVLRHAQCDNNLEPEIQTSCVAIFCRPQVNRASATKQVKRRAWRFKNRIPECTRHIILQLREPLDGDELTSPSPSLSPSSAKPRRPRHGYEHLRFAGAKLRRKCAFSSTHLVGGVEPPGFLAGSLVFRLRFLFPFPFPIVHRRRDCASCALEFGPVVAFYHRYTIIRFIPR